MQFVVPMGISATGNSGRFPQGKPAATESRYPTLINDQMYAGVFSCVHNPPNSGGGFSPDTLVYSPSLM